MQRIFLNVLSALLLILGSTLPARAQFNPDPPADPNPLYHLTTVASPRGYASGEGYYREGQTIEINCSAEYGYTFDHWTKDGAWYSDQPGFQYVMTGAPVAFVAHFVFTPPTPNDPVSQANTYRIYLQSDPAGKCSFNRTSGERYAYVSDTYIDIEAYPNWGYVFRGWYDNHGTLLSEDIHFNIPLPDHDITLTARFVYQPALPGDPGSVTTDIDNGLLGDVNGDGVVDMADAISIVNHFLQKPNTSLVETVADVNKDGHIDMADAISIVNIYLQK